VAAASGDGRLAAIGALIFAPSPNGKYHRPMATGTVVLARPSHRLRYILGKLYDLSASMAALNPVVAASPLRGASQTTATGGDGLRREFL
jgi:hypothetical protein